LATSQERFVTWTFDRPQVVRVDGERWGSARVVTVTVRPDALIVHA
jgi:diacylglycerol kinase family enzyme